jgi:hypothetical protein
VALIRHAERAKDQPDSLQCYPGQRLLQKYLGASNRSHVVKMLRVLVDAGMVERVEQQRAGHKRFSSNVYKLLYTPSEPTVSPRSATATVSTQGSTATVSPHGRAVHSDRNKPQLPIEQEEAGEVGDSLYGGDTNQTDVSRRAGGSSRSNGRSAGGNTSSTPRKRSRSNDSATNHTHTSAAAAGPRHPRARARRGKQTAHVDLHGNVSHRLSDDEVERRFAHTGPEQLPLELDHEHGFRFDRQGVLVAWPAWYDGEARLNLHIGSAALVPRTATRSARLSVR